MKLNLTSGLLCSAAVFASVAVLMAQDSGNTLFPPAEFRASVFAETANGSVDIESHQEVIHTTVTTTSSGVQGPGTVAPPAGPSPSGFPTGSPTGIPSSVKHRTGSTRTPVLHSSAVAVGSKSSGGKVTSSHDPKTFVNRRRTEHNAAGGGVQLAYFINRFVGIAADAAFLGGNPYVTAVTANVILRYPFEFGGDKLAGYGKDGKSDGKAVTTGPTWGVAPYVIFGGGGQWDGQGVGIADVGGGLEFRFKDHYGIYLESRWIVRNSSQNYAATTLGVSYNF